MRTNRLIPDNPLAFIKRCVEQGKILWTYHVNMRLKGRFIPREFILESAGNYEVIEDYPEDKYFPSYLVYSRYENHVFHVLFATDLAGDNIRVVTAYYPSLKEWETDLKTRRRSL
ncbi:MAG: DUF4258 domain-containing protein [Deltaproteobacteria bacterium]|nr:DUF4258 domain-containing protein [Deltaproteobacteria bacterium]